MKPILLSSLLLGSLLATGCTSGPQNTDQASGDGGELVYRTGSNIPKRDKPMTKEEKEKRTEESQRSMQQMQSTGAGVPKP